MKSFRHEKIRDIIKNNVIETQEELTEALRNHQIYVTQATVSRDIKEMKLIKLPTADNRYRYASPIDRDLLYSKNNMRHIFRDSVLSVKSSQNIVVVRTLPGAANIVAATMDFEGWEEILGTVAGNDTILVVVSPDASIDEVVNRLEMLRKV